MKKIGKIVIVVALSLLLLSCFQKDVTYESSITSIEVYDWVETKLIQTIEDEGMIKQLQQSLEDASTYSTANLDYPLPPYKLVFKDDEERVFSIGYYDEVVNLNGKGQFLDVQNDLLYGLEFSIF
ncbi:MAG TPA: hypothetical protein H9895_10570 [Candidatus Pseudogracilibacillus intestinigallinarum]|uniref:DUF4830 domain-containing protein n=1 Tax=Candidatus Pseudogracilibacillus intestinigallinarum TaxID=2838742 RepID=A0A9D1PN59_9BACI|nr:hypothetical protein [Candidatus Pseudogracilibacillus intestinigallinarum]